MKTAKRILTVALALMLIFALAAPSFAMVSANQPTNSGDSYYEQTTLSDYYVNGQITVHLHVTTFKYPAAGPIDQVYDVTVGTAGATNQLITVKDVLEKADLDNSNLSFTIQTAYNARYATYDSTLTGVQDSQVAPSTWFDGAILYKGSTPYACGYMFRINGMIPYFTHTDIYNVTTTEGCKINDAYVTANDTIDFYYTNVYTQALATRVRYVRLVSSTYDPVSNKYSATFQLLEAQCYKPSNQLDWVLTQWTPITGTQVRIYIDGSNTKITTDAQGMFTRTNLAAGSHSFKFKLQTDTYTTTSNGSIEYEVPYLVGMYSVYSF